jgi:hypothetical protein
VNDIRKVIEFYAHTRHEYKLLEQLDQLEADAELGRAVEKKCDVDVKTFESNPNYDSIEFYCGNCDYKIVSKYNYCPNCGFEFEWAEGWNDVKFMD